MLIDDDLRQKVEQALQALFQKVAEASKGKLDAKQAAFLFQEKAAEVLAQLQRGPVSWDNAPYFKIRDLRRPGMANQTVRLQVTVKSFTDPAPITVHLGESLYESIIAEAEISDSLGSTIPTLPIASSDLVASLDDCRYAGKSFEMLGAVADVMVSYDGTREFRVIPLDIRPLNTSLARIRATQDEIDSTTALIDKLSHQGRTPYVYVRQNVREYLGIIEPDNDYAFSRAIDSTIITAFSCGRVATTPGSLHHLVLGPSGIGKKLLAKISRILSPTYTEIGVTKVTEAGLCGSAHHEHGEWHHRPGLLPRAHGGAFIAEDVHELSPGVKRSLVGMLLKVMEDGRLLDSTAASTEYEIHASVHFDQNLTLDVRDGKGSPRYTLQTVQLPKHFLTRVDLITALPRDVERQSKVAIGIAKADDAPRNGGSVDERQMKLVVALMRDQYPEPSLGSVLPLMEKSIGELCSLNTDKKHLDHFHDFLPRLAISLRKTVKAICRSRALPAAGEDEVREATRLLRAKVEFLAQLEPGVVMPSSWQAKQTRQAWVQEAFGGQEVKAAEVCSTWATTTLGPPVDEKTIRRDLKQIGGQEVNKGVWQLPG